MSVIHRAPRIGPHPLRGSASSRFRGLSRLSIRPPSRPSGDGARTAASCPLREPAVGRQVSFAPPEAVRVGNVFMLRSGRDFGNHPAFGNFHSVISPDSAIRAMGQRRSSNGGYDGGWGLNGIPAMTEQQEARIAARLNGLFANWPRLKNERETHAPPAASAPKIPPYDGPVPESLDQAVAWLKRIGMTGVDRRLERLKAEVGGGGLYREEIQINRLHRPLRERVKRFNIHVQKPFRPLIAWIALFQALEEGYAPNGTLKESASGRIEDLCLRNATIFNSMMAKKREARQRGDLRHEPLTPQERQKARLEIAAHLALGEVKAGADQALARSLAFRYGIKQGTLAEIGALLPAGRHPQEPPERRESSAAGSKRIRVAALLNAAGIPHDEFETDLAGAIQRIFQGMDGLLPGVPAGRSASIALQRRLLSIYRAVRAGSRVPAGLLRSLADSAELGALDGLLFRRLENDFAKIAVIVGREEPPAANPAAPAIETKASSSVPQSLDESTRWLKEVVFKDADERLERMRVLLDEALDRSHADMIHRSRILQGRVMNSFQALFAWMVLFQRIGAKGESSAWNDRDDFLSSANQLARSLSTRNISMIYNLMNSKGPNGEVGVKRLDPESRNRLYLDVLSYLAANPVQVRGADTREARRLAVTYGLSGTPVGPGDMPGSEGSRS